MKEQTNSRILVLRVSVAVGLVCATIVCGTVSYLLLKRGEIAAYKNRYNTVSEEGLATLGRELELQNLAVTATAKAISYYHPDETSWPNVVMPGFYDTGAVQKTQGSFVGIIVSIVHSFHTQ